MIAMFVFAALGGAWFPLEFAGETFSTIGHFMPTAWAMDGFQNIIVRGMGVNSIVLPVTLIMGFGAAFFALAVWRFQYE
jgi:ABC-2 type transport system permease protein